MSDVVDAPVGRRATSLFYLSYAFGLFARNLQLEGLSQKIVKALWVPAIRPDRPIKLLPSRNTERMVQAREQENVGLVFVVSGEVTAFEGENVLLPLLAVQRIDMGNLSK